MMDLRGWLCVRFPWPHRRETYGTPFQHLFSLLFSILFLFYFLFLYAGGDRTQKQNEHFFFRGKHFLNTDKLCHSSKLGEDWFLTSAWLIPLEGLRNRDFHLPHAYLKKPPGLEYVFPFVFTTKNDSTRWLTYLQYQNTKLEQQKSLKLQD